MLTHFAHHSLSGRTLSQKPVGIEQTHNPSSQPCILTTERLTVLIDGKVYVMKHDNPDWEKANQLVKDKDWNELNRLMVENNQPQ